jgi:hypothetical protein
VSAAPERTEKFSADKDEQGQTWKTKHRSVRIALQRLAEAYPATLTLEKLTENLPSESVARICSAVFALVVAGQATASTLPTTVGRADAEYPKMWALARIEAAGKQPWLTSLNHLPVPLGVAPMELLTLLDGTNPRRALAGRGLKNGMAPPAGLAFGQNDAALEQAADQFVERVLTQLAFHALLEPADPGVG